MSTELRPSPGQTRALQRQTLARIAADLEQARRHLGDREFVESVRVALERATVGARRLNEHLKGLQK